MKRTRLVRALVALLMFLATTAGIVASASVASAEVTCSTGGDYQDNWTAQGGVLGNVQGITASAIVHAPTPCDGDLAQGTTWIGLQNTLGGVLKIGWRWNWTYNCNKIFAEYKETQWTADVQEYATAPGSCLVNGTTHSMSIQPVTSGPYAGTFEFSLDNTAYFANTPFGPSPNWTATRLRFGGEASYLQMNMPGSASNTTLFSHIGFYDSTDTAYDICGHISFSPTPNDNPSKWGSAGYSCDAAQIFTSVLQ